MLRMLPPAATSNEVSADLLGVFVCLSVHWPHEKMQGSYCMQGSYRMQGSYCWLAIV